MYIFESESRSLEFRLLLNRVAPYHSLLPRTVWLNLQLQPGKVSVKKQPTKLALQS